ncbi:VOC family protein [Listeria cornellensis]|uniref:Catechol-2,3-dioxygenase n=1 Tax=Listeria cornellensis FSL F6-0969 TaxID=1265820 RepID=W7BLQ0_9LIST|nr:VOC family protein [Listeria cornellensis]EUJ27899.1 Catechol-2,3-dioxygenase [Listeria cornellensis FSL F6-0969]
MAAFYKEIIGLKVITDEDDKIELGVDGKVLLELVEVKRGKAPKQAKTGLYHTAFLLPSRQELGSFLHHLLASNYPIDGAGDHIYSEALYFRDPDGNGIEVYADRPRNEWERDELGNLPMATNEVDGDGILMAGAELEWNGAPRDTTIGHIHLQVSNLEETRQFYQTILGFKVTTEIPSALFFAAGDYHHHIGTNVWAGRDLLELEELETGLAYFTIQSEELGRLENQLMEKEIAFQKGSQNVLTLEDPNGITIKIVSNTKS